MRFVLIGVIGFFCVVIGIGTIAISRTVPKEEKYHSVQSNSSSKVFGWINSPNIIEGSGNIVSVDRTAQIPLNFSEISVRGAVQLEFVPSETVSLTVEADDNIEPYIITEIIGGKLNVHFKSNYSYNNCTIKIRCSAPTLKGLDVHGSCAVTVMPGLQTDQCKVTLRGSSNLELLDGAIEQLTARLNGSSQLNAEQMSVKNADIYANGSCRTSVAISNTLSAQLNGSSNLKSTTVQAQKANIIARGSSQATIWTREIKATERGSARVQYKGNATIVS